MKYFWKDNIELSAQVDNFFTYLSESIEEKFNNQLTIVLLGSMSRGEATWKCEDGKNIIISDLEFFTICPSGFNRTEEFNKEIEIAKVLTFKDQNSVLFHIDNTYIREEEVPHLPRKIITYDAMNMGKVIIGDKYIIDKFPKISFDNINMEDIWDIMVHRMFYVLYYREIFKQSNNIDEYRYTIAKNSLDLMTVILACHDILNSGFKAKLEAIQKLNISKDFKKYFSYCLDIKFNIQPSTEYEIDEMEEIFMRLINYCKIHFKIKMKNQIVNIRYVIKRRLGILKRIIMFRKMTYGRNVFFGKLIQLYKNSDKLPKEIIKESYILNSYPKK